MVKVGDFCQVKDSRYVEYGVKKNTLVYLAGDSMVLVDEQDPYAYRKIFVAALVADGHVDTTAKALTMDWINLSAVSKAKQEKLYAQFEEDFTKEEES